METLKLESAKAGFLQTVEFVWLLQGSKARLPASFTSVHSLPVHWACPCARNYSLPVRQMQAERAHRERYKAEKQTWLTG